MICRICARTGLLEGRDYEFVPGSEQVACTYTPSPSSYISEDTSKVYHPSGLSNVTIRISCMSISEVPARTARVAGVYESSKVKLM